MKKNIIHIISAISAVLFIFTVPLLIVRLGFDNFYITFVIAMVLLKPIYRAHSYWIEASILILVFFFVEGHSGSHEITAYLPLTAAILMLALYRFKSRVIQVLVPLGVVFWTALAYRMNLLDFNHLTWQQVFLSGATFLAIGIYSFDNLRPYPVFGDTVDLILASHSGNTAHYTEQFLRGYWQSGKKFRIHRFHYHSEFKADLKGDALVLAFPVSGWKPPWPLIDYLIKELPRGNGKPAFILYTSFGGPENGGIVAWFLLTLKGYRVTGRSWAVYPMNVATLRPGPKKLWKWIDRLTPSKRSVFQVGNFGREYGMGIKTGLPFILWPCILSIPGYLLDNRWINRPLYRNYSWKKRCTHCGLCVTACTSHRLYLDEEGFPRPRGTCSLCLLCINICPTNAMQMRFLSEYGNPYRPRWPKYVITNGNGVKRTEEFINLAVQEN